MNIRSAWWEKTIIQPLFSQYRKSTFWVNRIFLLKYVLKVLPAERLYCPLWLRNLHWVHHGFCHVSRHANGWRCMATLAYCLPPLKAAWKFLAAERQVPGLVCCWLDGGITWSMPAVRKWTTECKETEGLWVYFRHWYLFLFFLWGGGGGGGIVLLSLPKDVFENKSLVQVMAWCHQAPSHYLNQWLSSVGCCVAIRQ